MPAKKVAKKDSVFFVPENIENLAKKLREKRIADERLRKQQKQEQEAKEKALRAENLKNSLVTGTPKFRHIVNGLIACKTICLKQINMSLLTLKSRSWKG